MFKRYLAVFCAIFVLILALSLFVNDREIEVVSSNELAETQEVESPETQTLSEAATINHSPVLVTGKAPVSQFSVAEPSVVKPSEVKPSAREETKPVKTKKSDKVENFPDQKKDLRIRDEVQIVKKGLGNTVQELREDLNSVLLERVHHKAR